MDIFTPHFRVSTSMHATNTSGLDEVSKKGVERVRIH